MTKKEKEKVIFFTTVTEMLRDTLLQVGPRGSVAEFADAMRIKLLKQILEDK